MSDDTGAKADYVEDDSTPKPVFSETRPGYIWRTAVTHPAKRFGRPRKYAREVEDGMIIERDVKVPVRGGVHVWVDIFRPEKDMGKLAPLIGWTPYGKHTPAPIGKLYPNAGVKPEWTSKWTAFEAPDPIYWTNHGYAIIIADTPGTWYSDQKATYLSPEETEQFYDLIEWAGTQDWSSGLVGLSGVSYLAVMQWRVAELHPPHLGAINPDEGSTTAPASLTVGFSDFYREVVHHGGIPDSSFFPRMIARWGSSDQQIEDLETELKVHPFFDALWESKRANHEKVTVPAYVIASWQDQGLHTRGTLEGWKKIQSQEKWLVCHGRKKWAYYYEPEQLEKQRAFFDKFLKGKKNTGVEKWPRAILEIRDGFYKGVFREEKEFPLARTEYRPLYLDAGKGTLSTKEASSEAVAKYDSLGSGPRKHRAEFEIVFDKETEITGYASANLFMESPKSADMHVFVTLWKLDMKGEPVGMTYYAQYEDGPAACGWIKASHRELDEKNSTPQQPILLHRREQKLKTGEVVELNIEIWASSTHFAAGEGLRLLVQGTDVMKYREPEVYTRHEISVNNGDHIIHTGGKYPSSLLLPFIPIES